MNLKNKKGVSLITLIITIIVIIIIAAISMQNTSHMPDEAHYTKYMQVMKNVQTGVESKKINNSFKGTTEEKLNAGFKKVILEAAPAQFISFSAYDEPVTGYMVDLETIDYVEAEYGKAYRDYESGDTLIFGENEYDVYVYDAEWNVYYVKGLEYEGSMNYTFK